MAALVRGVKNILRALKRKLESYLPRNMNVSSPIVQVYLGGEYESKYSLINFPSLFSPLTASSCIYDVALYGSDGSCIGRRSIPIKPFGSFEVRPAEIFGENLPDLGMFTAKIRSASPLDFSDKHLGKITSHIYALYMCKAQRSFALVHPQTTISGKSAGKVEWKSAVLLDSNKIRQLVAIQINPTNFYAESNLFLFRDGEENIRLSEMNAKIPPMGARKVEWDMTEDGITEGQFSIGASALTNPNAKPIIFTYFEDGTFSGMHA
jgi:hypothetical protein